MYLWCLWYQKVLFSLEVQLLNQFQLILLTEYPNVLHNIEVVPSFCKYRQLQLVGKRLAHNLHVVERFHEKPQKVCDYVSLTTLWYRNVHYTSLYTSILLGDCDREQAHL